MEVINENPNGGEFYGQGFPSSSSSVGAFPPPPPPLPLPPSPVGEHQEYSSHGLSFNALISFFGAAYRLFLFSYSQHGINFSGSFSYVNGYFREY
ncbi:NADH-ubiquinone oxidoreductase chain 4 [Gryllus bimaculatus]|nr:NADH-ubiquinone oxidoreductase chain 4 [Gryllus bimaculatus]